MASTCDFLEKTKLPNPEIESLSEKNDEILQLVKDVSKFTIKKILKHDTVQKSIYIEGFFKDREGKALIILEKRVFPIDESILEKGLFNDNTKIKEIFQNDIYSVYDFFPQIEHNALNARLIYPATEKHIKKYSAAESFMIDETPELYENVTLPKILKNSEQFTLEWIDNILNGSAEVERIIFNDPNEDTGFVMEKDFKWDGDLSTLYILAITRKHIKSIRDLNESHLPLLRNIQENGTKSIYDTYGVPKSQLRIFFHYQPSFYHLHVHFTTHAFQNSGTMVERAHLLSSVIRNIELMPDYYQKAVLTFKVSDNEPYKQYEEKKKNNEIYN